MGKRVLGGILSCGVGIVMLSGCATGTLNSPSIVMTAPATSTGVTTVTAARSAVAAAASSRAAASKQAAQLAAVSSSAAAARRSAAAQSAAEESAAQDSSADQAEPATAGQPTSDNAGTQQAPSSVLSEADALAHGWYDERGWVSPQTAARALAAGIPLGATVPDSLRCGTACGEDPTSGEIQAQKLAEQKSAQAQASSSAEPCAYMIIRGVCYATPSAASAAGE